MKFIVNGGNRLSGQISLSGAKNAASKAMIASLLTTEPCHFTNFPRIGDISITADLCSMVGSSIITESDTLKIHTPTITNFKVTSLHRRNRLPILALAPLLARAGQAEIPFLGGDKIGPRPVNFHLNSLQKMGAVIITTPDSYIAKAPNGLQGARISLNFPSVGTTENIIMAGVLARGRTVIKNSAMEPEIIELVKMLQKMGAIISFGANRTITIDGVKELHGVTHAILPDRNEAVSLACLAVATDGEITVQGAKQEHLISFLNALRQIGGDYRVNEDSITFFRRTPLTSLNIETDTHPGFMTDWQQPFVVLLTQAKGASIIHETIYEDRFGYTEDLNLMGADIKVITQCLGEVPCRFRDSNFAHSAIITGPTPLHGTNLKVRDLRAGMAHLIAALISTGQSEIDGVEEIDRGYYKIDERLRALGAQITRIQ